MNQSSGCDLQARYVNFAQIAYSDNEFVLEFGQLFQETQEARIHTRIVTSPAYARTLLDSLSHAVAEYEHNYPHDG
jgi:hypothetical protein